MHKGLGPQAQQQQQQQPFRHVVIKESQSRRFRSFDGTIEGIEVGPKADFFFKTPVSFQRRFECEYKRQRSVTLGSSACEGSPVVTDDVLVSPSFREDFVSAFVAYCRPFDGRGS